MIESEGPWPSLADYSSLARRFLLPETVALALAGSRARGDAGAFSDVDLWLFWAADEPQQPQAGSYLIEGMLVTVSDVTPSRVADWFENPVQSLAMMKGMRDARALHDPDSYFAALQERARAFTWDEDRQRRARAWVSAEMAGWVEEVYKGIEGLRRADVGRMLNARFGLSWGLSRTLQVYLGIFLVSDNSLQDQLTTALGPDSTWVTLSDAAFAIRAPDGAPVTLVQQVRAGLGLYVETARLVQDAILPAHEALVAHAVAAIRHESADWPAHR